MDNIKFRAWIKENYYHSDYSYMLNAEEIKGVMLDGSVLLKGETLFDEKAGWFDEYSSSDIELMQYKKLNDRHGTEIYDSDVLADENGHHYFVDDENDWEEIKRKVARKELEVIGNIYENPSPLEESK